MTPAKCFRMEAITTTAVTYRDNISNSQEASVSAAVRYRDIWESDFGENTYISHH